MWLFFLRLPLRQFHCSHPAIFVLSFLLWVLRRLGLGSYLSRRHLLDGNHDNIALGLRWRFEYSILLYTFSMMYKSNGRGITHMSGISQTSPAHPSWRFTRSDSGKSLCSLINFCKAKFIVVSSSGRAFPLPAQRMRQSASTRYT